MDLVRKEKEVAEKVEQITEAVADAVTKRRESIAMRVTDARIAVRTLEAHLKQAMDGYSKLVHYDASRTKTFIEEIKTHLGIK